MATTFQERVIDPFRFKGNNQKKQLFHVSFEKSLKKNFEK